MGEICKHDLRFKILNAKMNMIIKAAIGKHGYLTEVKEGESSKPTTVIHLDDDPLEST